MVQAWWERYTPYRLGPIIPLDQSNPLSCTPYVCSLCLRIIFIFDLAIIVRTQMHFRHGAREKSFIVLEQLLKLIAFSNQPAEEMDAVHVSASVTVLDYRM